MFRALTQLASFWLDPTRDSFPNALWADLIGTPSAIATYLTVSSVTGFFSVGETVTGGTSAATATVVDYLPAQGFLIVKSITGNFQASETLTGGTSSATATLDTVGQKAFNFSAGKTSVRFDLKYGRYEFNTFFSALGNGQTITYTDVADGPFQAAETITGGTSSATAIVIADDASSKLTVKNITGTFVVGETITGGTSLATATVSALSSLTPSTLTDDISFGLMAPSSFGEITIIANHTTGTMQLKTTDRFGNTQTTDLGWRDRYLQEKFILEWFDGQPRVRVLITGQNQLTDILFTNSDGTFLAGETVQGASGSDLATVISNSNGLLKVEVTSGSFSAGDSLTGLISQATSTAQGVGSEIELETLATISNQFVPTNPLDIYFDVPNSADDLTVFGVLVDNSNQNSVMLV